MTDALFSRLKVRYHPAWRLIDPDIGHWSNEARHDGLNWRLAQCRSLYDDPGLSKRVDPQEDSSKL